MLFSLSESPCPAAGKLDGAFGFILKLAETAEMTLVHKIYLS